jgi:hypothetical protein
MASNASAEERVPILAAVFHDKLALAFVADVFLSTAVIAVFFVRVPPGRRRWPWFVALCLLSTLAFGFVIYWWLNAQRAQPDRGA